MLKSLNRSTEKTASRYPIKILQFGEGNFLRAFADWCIQHMNEKLDYNSGVAVVQPIDKGLTHLLRDQDCLYHVIIRGLQNGNQVNETKLIDCVQEAIDPFINQNEYFNQATNPDLKIVISNTTESGIQFISNDNPTEGDLAKTFPGKLTQLLWKRFNHFDGSAESGIVFIPCELIEKNGEQLKTAILNYSQLLKLGEDFSNWIDSSCFFANTLVDRIVPGYPKEEIDQIQANIGYNDRLVVSAELFHLWVIQGPKEIQEAFPANQAGLNVKFVDDLTPYRTRKVRILNGAHTCMVPVGLLSGIETVREAMEDTLVGSFIKSAIDEEISPTIDLPEEELKVFANEVVERFLNPFIRHELKSISLNSISKYKVRVLPTLKDSFLAKGSPPNRLVFSLACLIKLYLSDSFTANDDADVLKFFSEIKGQKLDSVRTSEKVLANTAFWGEDLNSLGITEMVAGYLTNLDKKPISQVIKTI